MIVFITIPWFLPAYKAGGPIQSVANLVSRFKEDVEYKIFCSNTDLDGSVLKDIETDQWVRFNEHTEVYYASEEISKSLTAETEKIKPDILFIIGLYSWHFNIVPILFARAPKKIISVRGMLHEGALSQKKLKKKLFISAMRYSGITKRMFFHATNKEEEQFIKKEFGEKAQVVVAGNYGRAIITEQPLKKISNNLSLITIALISPMKNHLLVLEALATCTGNISWHIYGPVKDPAYWEKCKQQITLLPPNIAVYYHGETDPGDIDSLLARHHVFIMPSKSENFGHAIFEALSAGKPVITSHNTPWNSLEEYHAGINADTAADSLANAIGFFCAADDQAYLEFVTGALAYSAARMNTDMIDEEYRKLFLKS